MRALEKAAPDETVPVIVHLREQTDLGSAVAGMARGAAARSRLVSALQATATRSQAPLRAYLEGASAAGEVTSYTPFWIFNGIAVRAHPTTIRALATHPAVSDVRPDHYRRWLTTETPAVQSATNLPVHQPTSSPTWNVERIQAPQVWSSLHLSGTGAVVAGMDTGVDWVHPALEASYRGYNPHGPANHTYSWYDATGGDALYPVDGHGHGSHTLGTIVGQGGIGVAPGARWIGVRVLDNQGYGHESWIHAGFQWLLAPGGDPTKAPDVVNCSWGNDNGHLTTFQPDLQALRTAMIFAVFSSGNNGPSEGTVGSPASLPEAFGVGASDEYDEVTDFSSRGPSPWGELRPQVVAPGVHVRSSLLGGVYGEMNGTSMAAPHVSGIAALLRSVSTTLSVTRTAYLITSTATPLGDPIPNNNAGWGRVDAFGAVAALTQPGFISGTVRQAGNGIPISKAAVAAVPHGGGSGGTAVTGDDGRYLLTLAPTTYDLTVSAFGYEVTKAWGVSVSADETVVRNFSLTALPTGSLRVRITDADTGRPVTATIDIQHTPLQAVDSDHTFDLPEGVYTIRASHTGYQVVTTTVTVAAGGIQTVDLALPPIPSILLIDSGGWYYGSQIEYFRQALDDLTYTYDQWTIRHLSDGLPAASDLAPYDVVIWSAPKDAPGYIGAQDAITGYLSAGGSLLLSGQDVGFWDSGGGPTGFRSAYYEDYLKTRYVDDAAPSRVLVGMEDDIFAHRTITIAGSGGADNQDYPDVVAVDDPDAAAPVLTYQENGCGGLRVGTCLAYRAVYLSFGFEAINERVARRDIMSRALRWLSAPPLTAGLELQPESHLRIGLPGSVVTHALRVRHVGQGGATDTVNLSLEGESWRTELSSPTLTLAPCTSATVVLSVTIPATSTWDIQDVAMLTARSSLSPSLKVSATLTTKAPAPILLVDDDRWYEQQEKYQAAMGSADLPYDFWQIRPVIGGGEDRSPSLETLQRYPIVLWWTGYDWYAPITADELTTLESYLGGGGRLFLSSQDFLYYHHDDPFSWESLGVLTYTEGVTPTQAMGVPENPVGSSLGPYPLDYPFRNWSDGLEPTPGTAVSLRDQGRRGIALARRGESQATVFFAFPFEALPQTERPVVMERVVGWLSWLGDSTLTANRGAAAPGDALTYTIRLRNDGPEPVTASLSNTVPSALVTDESSIPGFVSYDPVSRCLSWNGPLDSGEVMTFTYRTAVVTDTALSSPIVNAIHVGLEDHHIQFPRTAVVRVGAPDLSPSSLTCDPAHVRPGRTTTCTLALTNVGTDSALTATAAVSLPKSTTFVAGSLALTGEGTVEAVSDTVRWIGPVSAGDHVTLSYRLVLPSEPTYSPLYSVAFLEDGVGGTWERPTWVILNPWRAFLPLAFRDSP